MKSIMSIIDAVAQAKSHQEKQGVAQQRSYLFTRQTF